MSRVLVTGGAGFIGSAVAAAFASRGWDVRVLDSLRADVHPIAPAVVDGIEFVRGDVLDPGTIDHALAGVDVVCHEAAKVGLGVDFSDAPDYVRTNVGGTAELLAGMHRRQTPRLVLASSMVVYGEGVYHRRGSSEPIRPAPRAIVDLDAGMFDPRDPDSGAVLSPGFVDEDTPCDPRNVYATTKLAQEHLAANWSRESGGRAALLRYHNVFGAGMPRDTPYAGVASIFRSALANDRAPRVFEDGAQRRDFVHVSDVARANVAAAEWTASSGPAIARAFNIGSGRVTTVLDIARALSDATGGAAPLVTGEYRVGDVRHITARSDRAAQELGWRATVPFESAVQEFATSPMRA